MMWIVIGNLNVLPMGLLLYAVPLSALEVTIAAAHSASGSLDLFKYYRELSIMLGVEKRPSGFYISTDSTCVLWSSVLNQK